MLVGHPLDSKQDGLLDRRGKPQLMDGLAIPAARSEKDVTLIERRLQQLLEDEGVAFGSLVQKITEVGLDRCVVEDGTDHASHAARR